MPKIPLRHVPPIEEHVRRWKDCTDCYLHEGRLHTVLARGTVPCDVIFIGEAPGKTENITASPFTGDSGQLLDDVIAEAVPKGVTYALTNLIACIPLDDDDESKLDEPPEDAVKACSPRLVEFVEICNPKLIVCVGKHAEWWTDPGYSRRVRFHEPDLPRVSVTHPGAILRGSIAMKNLNVKRMIVTIRNAIREYVTNGDVVS